MCSHRVSGTSQGERKQPAGPSKKQLLEQYTLARPAIHAHGARLFQAQVHAVAGALGHRLLGQPLPVDPGAGRSVGHLEITHVHADQIVEEVGALRRFDAEIDQVRFDNGARLADVGPGHRDAQKAVAPKN